MVRATATGWKARRNPQAMETTLKHRHSKRSPSDLHQIARKMGRKIADLGGAGDAVTEADLLTDFSASDIKLHIEAARDYARDLLGMKQAA